jgi:GH15 family glucan-1,4-alpha-glucosidase
MTTDETLSFLKKKSIEIILNGQSPSGAYIAGPTFTVYKFSWFRDGSFIADAMSRVGEIKSAEAFFDWGARIIRSKKESLLNGGILHARYTAEGEESSEEWPTFQLDGFGTFIWALCGHAERHKISTERWDDALAIVTDYLVKKWREPSFDWWEEYSAIHPATLASIYAGLVATHNTEALEVKAAIDLKNAKLDGSLIVCATPFHAVTAEEFTPTLEEIENKLVSPSGGVHRHQTDVYYGGGEWLLLTSFLGWHYHELGRETDARKKLIRMASFMDENGWLPEQTSEHMLAPEHYEGWVNKWGPSARPLLWSHAMFLTLATVLGI